MNNSPLCAYLMLRKATGGWKVEVCRDFATITQSWHVREESNLSVGLVHIGFDRPPPKMFNDVAGLYPGRMLLTGAAKHAMPPSFPCSAGPVGRAEDLDVFIGLKGWGYTLEDPTLKLNRLTGTQQDALVCEPQDWVALFLHEYPRFAEVLAEHQIRDDAGYLEREAKLEKSLRQRLGLFRFHNAVGTRCDDLCKISHAAPPWLQLRTLASLSLPTRSKNVYRSKGIKTVGDLADWSPESLRSLSNYGPKSLRDTILAVITALEAGPTQIASYEADPKSGNLLSEVRDSLPNLSERNLSIFVKRMGFETPRLTLQELADEYTVTRERIRQLVRDEIQSWLQDSSWPEIFRHKVSRIFDERKLPLQVADFEKIDPWFKGVSEHESFFINLVSFISENPIHPIRIGNECYLSFIDQQFWARAEVDAKKLLASGIDKEWTEEHVRLQLQGLFPDNAKEIGILLWDRLSRFCHFAVAADGSRTFTGYGHGGQHFVEVILRESAKPLHFEDIAKRMEDQLGKTMCMVGVRQRASQAGFLFGRGIYGLRQHVPFTNRQMTRIRCEAESIVYAETLDRQWHSAEILSELLDRLSSNYSALDKYILNIALGESIILTYLGRMTWTAATGDTDSPSRIDIQQAVADVLRMAGRPLHKDEIKKQLAVTRGTNAIFQIQAVDPIIPLKQGFWGINDRDVPISRRKQRNLIEKLVQCLDERQSGLHRNELPAVLRLQGFPPETFASVASQDERLKIDLQRYVYLAKWESSRRESTLQAVSAVLEASAEPLPIKQIAAAVDDRLGRTVSQREIYRLMKSLKAKCIRGTRKWHLTDSSS